MNKKFKIYTLGCKVNQYDSASLSFLLQRAGLKQVDVNADIAIVNTCCVTKTAIRKDKRILQRAAKENPRAKIILMGCWPQVYKSEAIKNKIDLVWGVGEHKKLVEEILSLCLKNKTLSLRSQVTAGVVCNDRARYFIKIQDGCEQFCSYCVIPYARGKLKSRDETEVLAEIKEAIKLGYREIVLCGIHLGLYKSNSGADLVELIKKIIKISRLGRIRLSSIEITDVNDELISLIAKSDQICHHLHLPLQSGNDKILKLMNRPYDTKYFSKKIEKIKKIVPAVALTTDVIVGFPGETKQDFKDTCAFVKQIGFSKLHVFPFSAHEKTAASKLPKQLSKQEKIDRAQELRQIGYQLRQKYINKAKQGIQEVVIENINGNKIKGLSQYYFEILCHKKDIAEAREGIEKGKIVKVRF